MLPFEPRVTLNIASDACRFDTRDRQGLWGVPHVVADQGQHDPLPANP